MRQTVPPGEAAANAASRCRIAVDHRLLTGLRRTALRAVSLDQPFHWPRGSSVRWRRAAIPGAPRFPCPRAAPRHRSFALGPTTAAPTWTPRPPARPGAGERPFTPRGNCREGRGPCSGRRLGAAPSRQRKPMPRSTAPCRFERTSKRRKGLPLETASKRVLTQSGLEVLLAKLGRNDPCPCGSYTFRFARLWPVSLRGTARLWREGRVRGPWRPQRIGCLEGGAPPIPPVHSQPAATSTAWQSHPCRSLENGSCRPLWRNSCGRA